MRKALIIFAAAIAAALTLGSCDGSDPAVLRVPWEADGNGYVQFRTNDTNDYSQNFILIPSDGGNALPGGGAAWTAEAEVIQDAGFVGGGHGLIVGYDTATGNFLALLIACNGEYTVVQNSGGILGTLTAWTASDAIKAFSQVNELKAVFAGSTITFSINGTNLTQKYNYTNMAATKAGFLNAISSSSYEGFPRYYSDRRFKLVQPVAYP